MEPTVWGSAGVSEVDGKLGLTTLFQELYGTSPVELPTEEAVFGMVLNRKS